MRERFLPRAAREAQGTQTVARIGRGAGGADEIPAQMQGAGSARKAARTTDDGLLVKQVA